MASSTGVLYSYKIMYFAFFDSKKGRKTEYDTVNRSVLASAFYSNTPLASLISISALTSAAYVVTLFTLYYLIFSKNLLIDINVLFLKNQNNNNMHIDGFSLFNFSFLN